MCAQAFDALDYVDELKNAGIPEIQANAHAKATRRYVEATYTAKELATKGDIQRIQLEMEKMKVELIKWMIAIAISSVGTLAMLILKVTGKF